MVKELPNIALAVLIAIITLTVGVIVLSEFRVASMEVTTISNETLTVANASAQSLANDELYAGTFVAYNDSAHAVTCASGNYTLSETAGTVLFLGGVANCPLNNTAVYMAYDYYADTDGQYVADKGITGLKTFSDWFAIIVIIVVAAVVIGLVVTYFKGREYGA